MKEAGEALAAGGLRRRGRAGVRAGAPRGSPMEAGRPRRAHICPCDRAFSRCRSGSPKASAGTARPPQSAVHLCGSACSGRFLDTDRTRVVICDRLLSLSRMPCRAVRLRPESHAMQVRPAELPAGGGHGSLPTPVDGSGGPEGLFKPLKAPKGYREMGHILGQSTLQRPGRASAPKGTSSMELPAGSGVGAGGAHFSEAGPGRGLPHPVPVPLCFPKCYTRLSASEILVCPGLEAVLVGTVPPTVGGPRDDPQAAVRVCVQASGRLSHLCN